MVRRKEQKRERGEQQAKRSREDKERARGRRPLVVVGVHAACKAKAVRRKERCLSFYGFDRQPFAFIPTLRIHQTNQRKTLGARLTCPCSPIIIDLSSLFPVISSDRALEHLNNRYHGFLSISTITRIR